MKMSRLLLEESGIPPVYWPSKLSDHPVPKIQDLVRRYLRGGRGGLFLYGPGNTGKTMIASIISKKTLSEGFSVAFCSFRMIMAASIDNKDRHEEIKKSNLVVIDDLGKAKPSDFHREILDDIVRTRCHNRKETIITSNWSADDLSQTWGEGLMTLVKRSFVEISCPKDDDAEDKMVKEKAC